MKFKKLIPFIFPCLIVTSTGCNSLLNYKENLDKYVATMEYHDGFKILQLTDIHWSTGTDESASKKYLKALIDEVIEKKGGIDLIEFTGDTYMLSDVDTVKNFLRFMEDFNIPYAMVWGNHDREGVYSLDWLANQHRQAKNCIFIQVDNDNVYGLTNYVINLNKEGSTKWQILNIDSGASYTESAFGFGRDYDYIRQDQAEWWKAENELAGNAPTIAYYHIPEWDIEQAWIDNQEGKDNVTKSKFFKFEEFASSIYNKTPYLFNIAKDNHLKLKGQFSGHAHAIDWTVDVKLYDDVTTTIGLGLKSGHDISYYKVSEEEAKAANIPELQEAFELSGASLVTLHDDETFDLDHVYFNERDDSYVSYWVRY